MHDRAVEIANEFPEGESRQKYQDAASKLRLPFWDWAMDPPDKTEGSMPNSLRKPTVTVTFPNGTKADIANPLYQYEFHPLNKDDFSALVSPP